MFEKKPVVTKRQTLVQAIEKRVKKLEYKKKRLGRQITNLQFNYAELSNDIYEMTKSKEKLQHNAKLRFRNTEGK